MRSVPISCLQVLHIFRVFFLTPLSLKNVNHEVLLFAQCMSVTAGCLLLGDDLNIFVVGLGTSSNVLSKSKHFI